ncbi:hypothetical protein GGF46_000176 [Coemansia sp. RSA 552]|nr:hypothetical protein GGF46_000176 [Coemansia sp. RSA 552]
MPQKIWWPQPPQYGAGPIHPCVPIWNYDDRYSGQPIVPHVITGPYHVIRREGFLQEHAVEVVLCIRDPSETKFLRAVDLAGIEFRALDVPADVREANIIPYFMEASRMIGELVAAGRTVLVCCSDGIDKSASFVAAYLMNTYALRASDAITFVQNHRYCATPSANGYRIKLMEYEPICAARGLALQPAMGDQKNMRKRADHADDLLVDVNDDVQLEDRPVRPLPNKRVRENRA